MKISGKNQFKDQRDENPILKKKVEKQRNKE